MTRNLNRRIAWVAGIASAVLLVGCSAGPDASPAASSSADSSANGSASNSPSTSAAPESTASETPIGDVGYLPFDPAPIFDPGKGPLLVEHMADREGWEADADDPSVYRNAASGCLVALQEPAPLPQRSLDVAGDEAASIDLLAVMVSRDVADIAANAQTVQVGSREEPGYFFDASYVYTLERETTHTLTTVRAFQDAGLAIAITVICPDEASVKAETEVAWGAVRIDEG